MVCIDENSRRKVFEKNMSVTFSASFLGAVERKFPRNLFPDAKSQAKKAANKAGLNVKQRLEGTGKYSQEKKELKRKAAMNKNTSSQ